MAGDAHLGTLDASWPIVEEEAHMKGDVRETTPGTVLGQEAGVAVPWSATVSAVDQAAVGARDELGRGFGSGELREAGADRPGL